MHTPCRCCVQHTSQGGCRLQLGRACMQAATRVWPLNPSLLACLPPQVCVDMGEPILRAADVPTTLEPTQVCA